MQLEFAFHRAPRDAQLLDPDHRGAGRFAGNAAVERQITRQARDIGLQGADRSRQLLALASLSHALGFHGGKRQSLAAIIGFELADALAHLALLDPCAARIESGVPRPHSNAAYIASTAITTPAPIRNARRSGV